MQSFDGAGLFPLDAAQAKQMAAINAANNLRNRSTSFLGESSTLLQDPAAMAQRPQQPPPSRQHGFLVSLAGVMAKRNTPLPPALTGVQTPGYDALSSTWQMLDIPDVGVIRIAGRDIELLKLWGLVKQSGGGQHLTTQNLWVNILPSFQLTEETLPTGLTVTQTLATYYQNILLPLEEVYRNNMQGKVHGVQRQPLPETPARRLSSASQGSVQNPEGTLENNDQDLGLKRKLESEEGDVKRARQKTETAGMNGVDQPSTGPPTTMSRPSRRTRNKIEFVPRAREIEHTGGRDLGPFEDDSLPMRRPMRELQDWGNVSVDHLALSIRSQLSTELAYALTTITFFSTMRGDTPNQGFPIGQCYELLDDMLDVLEDRAFGGAEDDFSAKDYVMATHKELTTAHVDAENETFASLHPRQGSKYPDVGPLQRPGNTVLAITNILRNLALIPDNHQFLVKQERMFDILLRLCSVTRKDGTLVASSHILSLIDLITVRRDVLSTLMHLCSPNTPAHTQGIVLSDASSQVVLRIAYRAFHLLASFIVDPKEAVSPLSWIQVGGSVNRPPLAADIALETFTRLAQEDPTRKVLSQIIPPASIRRFFTACLHRLPVADQDFQILAREGWLGYTEKIIMTIYELAFIAPPSLKRSLKADRNLGFRSVMLRLVQKFLTIPAVEMRAHFSIAVRRAVEAMKVLDDGEDLFDTSEVTVTTLSFGMGYGEGAESNHERGTGLLGGHRELTWELLMQRDVLRDVVLFNELESLARVE